MLLCPRLLSQSPPPLLVLLWPRLLLLSEALLLLPLARSWWCSAWHRWLLLLGEVLLTHVRLETLSHPVPLALSRLGVPSGRLPPRGGEPAVAAVIVQVLLIDARRGYAAVVVIARQACP